MYGLFLCLDILRYAFENSPNKKCDTWRFLRPVAVISFTIGHTHKHQFYRKYIIYARSSKTRREFFREILYKNISIIAIQHGKFILLTPLAIFPILLGEIRVGQNCNEKLLITNYLE